MWYSTPFDGFTPEAWVGTAAAPIAFAMLLRLLLGRTQLTHWGLTLGAMWFAFIILLAPYSTPIRQDLVDLGSRLR